MKSINQLHPESTLALNQEDIGFATGTGEAV